MPGVNSFRVVIGIDFGTSRSGYAFAFADDRKIFGNTNWPAQPAPYPKTVSQILYSPNHAVEAWGYNARKRLAELRQDKEATKYFFLKNFKMALHERPETVTGEPYLTHRTERFPVINVIADYLRQLKEMALKDVSAATVGLVNEDEILWCLSVPAIWTDADKQMMRMAAQRAELVGAHEPDRLLLVLEPEAAAVYCQEKERMRLDKGTRFMVIDSGGGTIDITAYEVVEGGISEIVVGTGGKHGSSHVDHSFADYIATRLTPEAIKKFGDEDPIEYVEFMGNWERIKCDFDHKNSSDITYFPIQAKLWKMLQEEFPHVLDNLAEQQNGDDAAIHLSRATMLAIFNPTLHKIIERVKEEFLKIESGGCQVIFLVGGFSKSPLLQQRIKDELGNKVKKIIIPPEPGSAVLEGAVTFGLNPSVIRARRSRLTYGCKMESTFEDGVDPEGKRIWREDKDKWNCKDRFRIFVKAGEVVREDQEVAALFYPPTNDKTEMEFEFYSTPKQQVRYVDEAGVDPLGSMTVEMPDTTGGVRREIEVIMLFGQTEIKVRARDLTSGREFKTHLRFSSTYSAELLGR